MTGKVIGSPETLPALTSADKVLFVGHSGVGKSTLINALVPTAYRATGVVSAIGKGRHTSSSVVALRLPIGESWVIDTPGVRSFGLGRPIALAFVKRQHAKPDTAVSVRVGERTVAARVSGLPFMR